jgi:GTPase SAR1 family protein
MSNPPLSPHDHIQKLIAETKSRSLNEADTRHQVIDVVLHDILCWPRSSTRCEEYVAPGYADYVLFGTRDRRIIIIEAKREGEYFELPTKFVKKDEQTKYIPVKTLLTDKFIHNAITQVRKYCVDKGCEFAAISNGRQWIFFRTFSRNRDWDQLQAFVIDGLEYFDKSFTEASNFFSYTAITSNASLTELFGEGLADHRPRYFPKEKITAYNHEVSSNRLAPVMRPLIMRYFGKLTVDDPDFMERCYVNNREYRHSEENVKQLIHDSLSPYFREYNVQEFFDELDGGELGRRISSSARERGTRDVIVLFGGKGCGKSTFVNRLLFHNPPNAIKHFTQIAVVDLLECPETKENIEDETWKRLCGALDSKGLLNAHRAELLDLFEDRYKIAQQQTLAGLDEKSEAYNLRLNDLIEKWKSDLNYVCEKLSDYWKKNRKGLIVVIDNTDQFSLENQDFCFTLAHDISTKLDCLVVISMREERFHFSRIHGTLDAFQNAGFHLASPESESLFQKRLVYLLRILDEPARARKVASELSDTEIENVKTVARVFLREFRRQDSHLTKFLKACAHGNMRLALELFREFSLSGYTRVDEMIDEPRWTLQVHQVLRPMMIPYRLFYDERKSSIPNVFQVRSEVNGSHFTGIRLLKLLASGMDALSPDYVPLSFIRAYFADTFNMLDDCEKTLDLFLKGGVVESNNRIDEYDDAIDSLKITPYGIYLVNELPHNFSYLDLVCLDCGVHDQGVADSLANLGNQDRDLFLSYEKLERINIRVEKVKFFLDYLQREENIEREVYELDTRDPKIMPELRAKYDDDQKRVLRSAKKNYSHGGDE